MNLRNWIIGGVAVAALSFAAPSAEARPFRGGGFYGRPAVRAYSGTSYGYRAYPGYYGRSGYGGYGGYGRGYGGGFYGRSYYGSGVGIGIGLGPSYYSRW